MTLEQDPAISLSFVDRPSRLRRDRNKTLSIPSRLRWYGLWHYHCSVLGAQMRVWSRVERGSISLRSHNWSRMKARSIFHHSELYFIKQYETVLIPDKPSHLLCVQIWWNQIISKKNFIVNVQIQIFFSIFILFQDWCSFESISFDSIWFR